MLATPDIQQERDLHRELLALNNELTNLMCENTRKSRELARRNREEVQVVDDTTKTWLVQPMAALIGPGEKAMKGFAGQRQACMPASRSAD